MREAEEGVCGRWCEERMEGLICTAEELGISCK